MASVQVKFNNADSKPGKIFYLVCHNQKTRRISTSYVLYPEEWKLRDKTSSFLSLNLKRKTEVSSIFTAIEFDLSRLRTIIDNFYQKSTKFSVDDIVSDYESFVSKFSLNKYMGEIIENLRVNNKYNTSQNYQSTLNSFIKFLIEKYPNINWTLDWITSDNVKAYESWLNSKNVTPNTSSFYMRILRAVYNRAVDEQVIINKNPFRHVYTGIDKTVKRALPLKVISKIKNLELSSNQSLDWARDIFLLSFYLRGMSFIDMAFLKDSNLQNGYVVYRRRKTGQQLTIKWTCEMQKIIDKYPSNQNGYLIPVIFTNNRVKFNTYRYIANQINQNLKIIARMLNIELPLTLYVARHSWASAAHSKGIPVSIISQGMGHDSETTTRIYLSSLDSTLIDRANSLIMNSL